jgi:hypothetical protein
MPVKYVLQIQTARHYIYNCKGRNLLPENFRQNSVRSDGGRDSSVTKLQAG